MSGLRSDRWFGGDDEVAVLHRVALPARGSGGGPVIGIADTTSDLNPCNAPLAGLMVAAARGIRAAGAIPVRFPVMSLGEDLMKPTAMLYRNLAAMQIEEQVRSNPIDGLVLTAGCDKTVAAALLGAASADVPALLLLSGPRSAPIWRGRPLGTGTDLWRALEERRAGLLDDDAWHELEACLTCAGPGTCTTMGTASTLALLTEVLGLCLPGCTGLDGSSPVAEQLAERTGARVVEMVESGARPADVVTQAALDNALRALAAVGGSTNAVIHLAALAGRLGLDGSLAHADALWRDVPLLADVEPCGRYLAAALPDAGGVPTLLAGLAELAERTAGTGVDLTAVAGDGRPWQQHVALAPRPTADGVLRTAEHPVAPAPTMVALTGSLAPDGCVLKVAAASPDLLQHTGPALVLDDYEDMRRRLDDPDLAVDDDVVLVVRGIGPVGAPGMPEWGMAPIPAPLVRRGVRDVVRVSDGRMSGTSFGTVALHVAPEAQVGGPLAHVRDGDRIRLDVPARRLDLLVDPAELARRAATWRPDAAADLRGWPLLYRQHVGQAPTGADLDVLAAPRPEQRVRVEPTVGRS
ncbi:MAG: dihydroxy-acid dehydratase [Actinobacteria bacterium]|nr:dihydroxy-acid dehydratase [Actinomycetota bacterium]